MGFSAEKSMSCSSNLKLACRNTFAKKCADHACQKFWRGEMTAQGGHLTIKESQHPVTRRLYCALENAKANFLTVNFVISFFHLELLPLRQVTIVRKTRGALYMAIDAYVLLWLGIICRSMLILSPPVPCISEQALSWSTLCHCGQWRPSHVRGS